MPIKIIGLLGRSRSGKDTVADHLMVLFPEYQIKRLSAPLKEASVALYGFTSAQIEGPLKEVTDARWSKTPRECIQSLTEYMMDHMGKDFFTKRLWDQCQSQHLTHIIIPDIRYEHDIYEIHRRGGIVIKVERPNNPFPRHAFENQIDFIKGDYRILNDSTIESLQKQVEQLIKP